MCQYDNMPMKKLRQRQGTVIMNYSLSSEHETIVIGQGEINPKLRSSLRNQAAFFMSVYVAKAIYTSSEYLQTILKRRGKAAVSFTSPSCRPQNYEKRLLAK